MGVEQLCDMGAIGGLEIVGQFPPDAVLDGLDNEVELPATEMRHDIVDIPVEVWHRVAIGLQTQHFAVHKGSVKIEKSNIRSGPNPDFFIKALLENWAGQGRRRAVLMVFFYHGSIL